jgi:predicted dehydrogenase
MNSTRRDFSRFLGVGFALSGLSTPAFKAQETQKVRYCIVGLGRISLGHFMPGCKMSQRSEVIALVSGHRDKAEKTAAEYNVPAKNIYTYENYDEIGENKEIDAVYIALPNSMHAEYTIRAANAGKHVLCEKPMATTVQDAQNMMGACKAANKKLMIAYRCQYEATNLHAVQHIRAGKLGKLQAIESANGFNIKPGEWRLDKKLAGGGPLMDVGIYSLNACRFLTGEDPEHLEGFASIISDDGRFTSVEENVSWTMKFPSGIVASCNTTYGANMSGFYRVHGSQGTLELEPAFSYQGIQMKAKLQGGEAPIEDSEQGKDPSQFVTEADYMAGCILDNKEPKTNGEEGLKDMKFMEQIYKSAGIKMS